MSAGRISRKKFIRLGTVVGLSSAAVPLVSACGGGGSSAASGESASAPGAAAGSTIPVGPEVGAGQVIAKESGVKTNSAVPFTQSETGQPAVLVRLQNGEFVAYSAVCTHQQCTVVYQLRTERLACPCHGGVFNPAKGAAVEAGPPPRPLPKIGVEIRDGKVVRA